MIENTVTTVKQFTLKIRYNKNISKELPRKTANVNTTRVLEASFIHKSETQSFTNSRTQSFTNPKPSHSEFRKQSFTNPKLMSFTIPKPQLITTKTPFILNFETRSFTNSKFTHVLFVRVGSGFDQQPHELGLPPSAGYVKGGVFRVRPYGLHLLGSVVEEELLAQALVAGVDGEEEGDVAALSEGVAVSLGWS